MKTHSVITHRMTKFERARIIGTRAQQIEKGAKPFVDLDIEQLKKMTPYEIACMEFEQSLIDITIRRKFPNHVEYWNINELS